MGVIKKVGTSGMLASFIDGVFGLAPTGGIISDWFTKKQEEAKNVLLLNIRQGDIDSVHKDEFLSMLYRFNRSVLEGSGKRKIILLAKIISGISRVDREKTKAKTFNDYCELIDKLDYDDIDTIGFCIKEAEQKNVSYDKYELLYDVTKNAEGGVTPEHKIYIFYERLKILESKGILFSFDIHKKEDVSKTAQNNRTVFGYGINEEILKTHKVIVFRFSNIFLELISKYGISWKDVAEGQYDD